MNKKLLINSLIIALIIFFIQKEISAQYSVNNHYAGPSIGLSFLGSTFQLGGNYEYGMYIENIGNVGIGGVFRYWGYSENFYGGKWSYTNILFGAQGNYHFKIKENGQLDPYAGIVLAYDGGSIRYSGPGGIFPTPSPGGFWLGFQGGLRYFIQPNLALTGRVGFGTLSYGALEVGVDWKF
jgi:hypothetical protein